MKRFLSLAVVLAVTAVFFTVGNFAQAEECEVIAEKLVKPADVSVEFDVPKTKLKGVKLGVEQSPIELKMVQLHYAKRADDEYSDLGTLQPGEQTRLLDAPGMKKVKIKGISVQYKIPEEGSQGALIQVWGCK